VNSAQDKRNIKNFGRRVRFFRKKQKISQSQLAFECGLDLSQIARIERGEINTGVSNIFRIAESLNIQPKDLLDF
jgi:transcriptional regulator with XRE-family HTH domain